LISKSSMVSSSHCFFFFFIDTTLIFFPIPGGNYEELMILFHSRRSLSCN
jgi:hypothetical protein